MAQPIELVTLLVALEFFSHNELGIITSRLLLAVSDIACGKNFDFLSGKWFHVKSNFTHDSTTRY